MPKRMLSWQSKFDKFLQMSLLPPSNVPHFSPKMEYVITLKMINFWRNNLAFFYNIKKKSLFLIFVNKIFFQ